MFITLVFLFTVLPAVEIYLLFKIGGDIGIFYTFLIVVFTGILGASLAKSQGLMILTKIQSNISQGNIPGKHIIHGLMVFAGGLLLLTPGFLTDFFGFSLVLPGSRHFLYIWVKLGLEKAAASGNFKFQSFQSGSFGQSGAGPAPFGHDQEADVINDDNVIEADFTRKE